MRSICPLSVCCSGEYVYVTAEPISPSTCPSPLRRSPPVPMIFPSSSFSANPRVSLCPLVSAHRARLTLWRVQPRDWIRLVLWTLDISPRADCFFKHCPVIASTQVAVCNNDPSQFRLNSSDFRLICSTLRCPLASTPSSAIVPRKPLSDASNRKIEHHSPIEPVIPKTAAKRVSVEPMFVVPSAFPPASFRRTRQLETHR